MDIVGRSLFFLLINMYLNNLKYVGALKNKRSFIFVFVALFHPLESYAQEAVEQPQNQVKQIK